MDFFQRLGNWFGGKGWSSDEERRRKEQQQAAPQPQQQPAATPQHQRMANRQSNTQSKALTERQYVVRSSANNRNNLIDQANNELNTAIDDKTGYWKEDADKLRDELNRGGSVDHNRVKGLLQSVQNRRKEIAEQNAQEQRMRQRIAANVNERRTQEQIDKDITAWRDADTRHRSNGAFNPEEYRQKLQLRDAQLGVADSNQTVGGVIDDIKNSAGIDQQKKIEGLDAKIKSLNEAFTDEDVRRRDLLTHARAEAEKYRRNDIASFTRGIAKGMTVDLVGNAGEGLADTIHTATGEREKLAKFKQELANHYSDMLQKSIKEGNEQARTYYSQELNRENREINRILGRQVEEADPLLNAGRVANAASLPVAFAAQATGVGVAARTGLTGLGTSGAATTTVGKLIQQYSPQLTGRLAQTTAGKVLNSTPAQLVSRAIPGASPRLQAVAAESVANVLSGMPQNIASTAAEHGSRGRLEDYLVNAATGAAMDAAFPVAAYGVGRGAHYAGKGVKHLSKRVQALDYDLKTQALRRSLVSDSTKPVNTKIANLVDYEGAPDSARVNEYKQAIQDGQEISPLLVMRDSDGRWSVEDGKHRLQAYRELGMKRVPVLPVDKEKLSRVLPEYEAQQLTVSQHAAHPAAANTPYASAVSTGTAPMGITTYSPLEDGARQSSGVSDGATSRHAHTPYGSDNPSVYTVDHVGQDLAGTSSYDTSVAQGGTSRLESTLRGFDRSANYAPVARVGDTEVVIGDYGRNAAARKASSADRFDASELSETLRYVTNAYKSGDSSFRKDNLALVATMPDGEKRVVYTRLNRNGQEEIINWHKITIPEYEDGLKSYGTPAWNRTRNFGLEHLAGNPSHGSAGSERGLARSESSLHDSDSIAKTGENVNREDSYKPTKPGFFGTSPEDYRYKIKQLANGKYGIFEEYTNGNSPQLYSSHSNPATARREAQRLAAGLEKPIQVEEVGKSYNGFTERSAEIELRKLQATRPEYDWEIKPSHSIDHYDIEHDRYGVVGVLREDNAQSRNVESTVRQEASEEMRRDIESPNRRENLDAEHTPTEQDQIRQFYTQAETGRFRNTPQVADGDMRVREMSLDASKALETIKKFDDVLRGIRRITKLDTISDDVAAKITQATGVDVRGGASIELTNQNAIHIHNRHIKNPDDPRPLGDYDIAALPEVIKDPDTITVEKVVRGAQRIKFEREMKGNKKAVVEVIKKGNALNVVTYFNDSSSGRPNAAEATSGYTLETGQLQSTNPNSTVAKTDENVKGARFKLYEKADISTIFPRATAENIVNKIESATPAQRRLIRERIKEKTGFDIHDIRGMKQYAVITQSVYNELVGTRDWIAAGSKVSVKGAESNRKPDVTEFAVVRDPNDKVIDLVPLDGQKHTIERNGTVVDKDGRAVGSYVGIDESGNQHAYVEGKPVNLENILGDIDLWGNKNAAASNIERIIDMNAPDAKTAQTAKEFTVVFKDQQEAAMKVELRDKRDALARLESRMMESVPKWRLRRRVTEDMFDLAENKVGVSELSEIYGRDYVDKYMKPAAKWWRQIANDTLSEVNAVLVANGYDPIPWRKDYAPHVLRDPSFFEKVGLKIQGLADLGGSFSSDVAPGGTRGGIPDAIVGKTNNTGARRKWNPFAQARRGDMASRDFFGAIDKYFESMLYNKYMTPAASRVRVVENAFRTFEKAKQIKLEKAIEELGFNEAMKQRETGKPHHKNFKGGRKSPLVMAWQEYGNILAGKTNAIDRVVIDSGGELGNKALDLSVKAQGIVGANAIPGSASAAMAQMLSIPQTFGRDNPISFMKAIKQMVTTRGDDATDPLKKSAFMTARYTDASSRRRGIVRKYTNVMSKPMEGIEKLAGELSWRSAYNEAIRKGLTGRDAITQADLATKATLAGRGIGDRPMVMNSKALGAFTQFGLEVNNTRLQVFKDFTPAQKMRFIFAAAASGYVTNMIMGQAQLPDLLKAVYDIYRDFADDDDDKDDSLLDNSVQALQRMLGEGSKFIPGAPAIAGALMDDKTKKAIFGTDSDVSRYGAPAIAKIIKAGVSMAEAVGSGDVGKVGMTTLDVLPTGAQIKRSIQGGEALSSGHTRDGNGNVQATIDASPVNMVKGLLFGKGALDEQKSFYEAKHRPLSEDQTKTYDEIRQKFGKDSAKVYLDDIHRAREVKSDLKKTGVTSKSGGGGKSAELVQAEASIKMKSGDWREENGLVVDKQGNVQKAYHKALAQSQGETDEAYANWMKAYNIDKAGEKPQQKNSNPTIAKLQEQKSKVNTAATAVAMLKDEKYRDLPDWVKERYYEKAGYKKHEVEYAAMASFKPKELLEGHWIPRAKELSHDQLMQELTNGRRQSIAGRELATPGIIDNLMREGYISRDEARLLKRAKFAHDGTPKQTASQSSGRGGGRGGSGSSRGGVSLAGSVVSAYQQSVQMSKALSSKSSLNSSAPQVGGRQLQKTALKRWSPSASRVPSRKTRKGL